MNKWNFHRQVQHSYVILGLSLDNSGKYRPMYRDANSSRDSSQLLAALSVEGEEGENRDGWILVIIP